MGTGIRVSIQISFLIALGCFYQHPQFVKGSSSELDILQGEEIQNSRSHFGKRSVRNLPVQNSLSTNLNYDQQLLKADGESDPTGTGRFLIKKRSIEVPEPGDENFIDKNHEKRRAFIGKRGSLEEEKRRAFIGKRDEFEEEKRRAFIGKRVSDEEEKRRAFIGKRGSLYDDTDGRDIESVEPISDTYEKRRAFIGKRDSSEEEKRRSFIGKRLSDSKENLVNYLQYKNQQMERRRNFIGKRIAEEIFKRRAFIGKRDAEKRRAFIGKRAIDDLDLSESDSMTYDKRRAFIGKRAPDNFENGSPYSSAEFVFDTNNEEKRRAFIGKRKPMSVALYDADLNFIEMENDETDIEKRRAFIG